MWPILAVLIFVLLAILLVIFLVRKRESTPEQPYLLYAQDGLWDLYLGAILLLLGLAEWFEWPAIGIIPAVLYPILLVAKQAITAPRLRPEEMPPLHTAQQRSTMLLLLGLTVFLVAGFFVLATVDRPAWLNRTAHYLPSALWLFLTALCVVWAYRSGARRLYLYALLFLIVWVGAIWLDLPLYVYALGLGAIIGAVGFGVSLHFVQEHPKLTIA